VNVEGHREALEQRLRNRVKDMDYADHSSPSRWSDFSHSTGHLTINLDATARIAYSHAERALQIIALVNQNNDLKNHLADEHGKMAAVLAQVQLLQEQLTASQLQSGTTTPVDPDDMALDIHGGGGNSEESASGGAQAPLVASAKDEWEHLRGNGLGQGLGSSPATWLKLMGGIGSEESASRGAQWPEDDPDWFRGCAPGWGRGEGRGYGVGQDVGATVGNRAGPVGQRGRDMPAAIQGYLSMYVDDSEFSPVTQGRHKFFQAAEIHWKWPRTDPQHPQSSQEPPPGHRLNIYTMTEKAASDYVMQLGMAGTAAFLAHVEFVCWRHSKWEAAAERVIMKDRQTGQSPDDEARRTCSLDSDESLWILAQLELAKLHPGGSPQYLWSSSHDGYVSGIEAGTARNTMNALMSLERDNEVTLPLLARLVHVRESSYLEYVALANQKPVRDKLLQVWEVIPIRSRTPSVAALVQHFEHYVHPSTSFAFQGRAECPPAGTSQQSAANQSVAISELVCCTVRGFSSTYSPDHVSSPQPVERVGWCACVSLPTLNM
jgi:hypothetical protein